MVRSRIRWLGANLRRAGIVLAVPAVALMGFVFTKTAVLNHYALAQSTATPFVLEMEVYVLKDQVEGELLTRKVVARRSDGTSVLKATVFGRVGLEAGLMGRRINFIDGSSISLVDWLHSKTTWPRPSAEAAAFHKARILPPLRIV